MRIKAHDNCFFTPNNTFLTYVQHLLVYHIKTNRGTHGDRMSLGIRWWEYVTCRDEDSIVDGKIVCGICEQEYNVEDADTP